jgi:hypothetical protein
MFSEIDNYVFNNEGSDPAINNVDTERTNQSIDEFLFGDEADLDTKIVIDYPDALDIGKYLTVYEAGKVKWDVFEASTYWGRILGTLSEQEDLQAALDAKVDKITGYGLSQNDLTDALKATYDGYASTISGKENTGVAAGLLSTHESTYTHSDIATNTDARHSHSNKATLDLIDVAFTTTLKSNYDTAYTNSHTHSNKATLDSISAAFTSDLKSTYDGYEITISGKEPALGNPSVSGYVLSSTDEGVRSWVAQSAAISNHSSLNQLDYASAGHTGFEPTVTKGNLTETTSSILTITGGTSAVIGSGTTIAVQQADATHAGYLSSTDWNTFNNKSSFSGSYNDLTEKPSIPTALSELSDDSTHRLVTDTEKSTWNGKQDGHANLTSLSGLTYSSVSFVKMTDSNTFALDTVVLGSAAEADTSDFDAAGSAASVAGDLSTHEGLTGSNVHGLGTASTHADTDYQDASSNLTSLAALSYVSASFVKMTAANTFSLDTNTYYKSGDTATFANITDNGLTASKIVFTDASKGLTSTGIGTSSQFLMGDGSLNSDVYLDETVQVNAQTGTTYTLQSTDNGKLVTLNNGSSITLTVPASLGAGFNCQILQLGAGQVTVSPSSTTVNNADSHTKLRGQYSSASLVAYAADTFLFQGDTAT